MAELQKMQGQTSSKTGCEDGLGQSDVGLLGLSGICVLFQLQWEAIQSDRFRRGVACFIFLKDHSGCCVESGLCGGMTVEAGRPVGRLLEQPRLERS